MAVYAYQACWADPPVRDRKCYLAALPRETAARLINAPEERLRQSAAAWLLLRWGLGVRYGRTAMPRLRWSAAGKPAFASCFDPFFSLSHTKGAALCVLGDAAVGADVERLRAVAPARAARLQLPPEAKDFFAGWVERESRIKLRGESALQCREPVRPAPGERYHVLEAGAAYAAGVCVLGEDEIVLERTALDALVRGI